jgi:hypothetical protein
VNEELPRAAQRDERLVSEAAPRDEPHVPSARDAQAPKDAKDTVDGSWVTGTGDEEDDPLRKDAAARAQKAVEPGRERE